MTVGLAAGAAVPACAPLTSGPADASDEHTITGSSPDAGAGDALVDSAVTLSTAFRVAQLSNDIGAIDVCYRALSAQTFTGPIFAMPAQPTEAGASTDASGEDGAQPAEEAGLMADAATDARSMDATVMADGAADAGVDATRFDAYIPDATTPDASGSDATWSDAASSDGGVVSADEGGLDSSIDTSGEGGSLDSGATALDATGDGPLPTKEAGVSSGGGGLTFLNVSNYLPIAGAGTFEIVVVPAGQGSCTGAILDQNVTLDDGKRGTILIFGSSRVDAGPDALALMAIVDDPTIISGATRTRIFDGALAGTQASNPQPLLVSVDGTSLEDLAWVMPGAAPGPNANPPTADVLGYHTDAPITVPAHLRLQQDADGGLDAGPVLWQSAAENLHLYAASVHSGFIIQDALGELGVLWCDDASEGTSSGSALASCTLLTR